MPDTFEDALDRMEIGADEIDEFGSVRTLLRNKLGMDVSGLQIATADEHFSQQRELAQSQGFTMSRSSLMEGSRLVSRVSLRNARGQFVARGAKNVTRFLRESLNF